MRVITQYPGMVAQIRPQRQRSLGDGSIEITTEPIYAPFKSVEAGAMIYENEEAAALRHFSFHGNTQDQGEAIPTNPMNRLAVFDTDEAAQAEGWDADTKQRVEERLMQMVMEEPASFLIVTDTPIAPPFPRYDTYDGTATQLVVKLIEDGYDLELTLHYERVFGQKREEVIEALEEAIEMSKEHIVSA